MEIEYLKEPLKMKWYITNRCNLNCKFCYLNNHFLNEPSQEDINTILRIIEKIRPIKVSILGGEPTESEYFFYIVNQLENMGIRYSFSTNGQTLERKRSLLNFLEKAVFLEEIQISLESVIEHINDSLRGKGSYQKVLSVLKKLKKLNIKIVVATVINRKNCYFLDEMIYLLDDLGVQELRIIPFIPLGTGEEKRDELFLTSKEIESFLKKISKRGNIKISSYFERNRGELGCGAGTISVVVNSDLTLSACDLLTKIEKTSQKITKEEDFFKIWKEDEIFEDWRVGKNRCIVHEGKCPIFWREGGYEK